MNLTTMHPRQAEILETVPDADRSAVLGYAHLLQNTGGGRLSGCLATARQEYEHGGRSAAHLNAKSRQDNITAMIACGCESCKRDAARLTQKG
jgi:hypothetical protein